MREYGVQIVYLQLILATSVEECLTYEIPVVRKWVLIIAHRAASRALHNVAHRFSAVAADWLLHDALA